jgi:molybdate transport system substrate-binding protein
MKPKSVITKTPGEIGTLVANGEAEIGVNQIQDFVLNPGVEVAGPLPSDLQNTVVFSAVIIAGVANTVASKALINFLRSPGAAAVIKAKGLEPATP